jgi:hypothetical protein
MKNINEGEYIFKLEDFAFSAGVPRRLYNININEISFPEHLTYANLDPTESSKFNYARTFHQFIVSMITNRPIHCYVVLPGRAQRTLWSSQFADRPPLNFIYVCHNHYVALLPKEEFTTNDERYTYFTEFMSELENQEFRNREQQDITANEILSAENQGQTLID